MVELQISLPLLAAAVLLLYYGREPVLGHGWGLLCQGATSRGPELKEKWLLARTLGGGLKDVVSGCEPDL